ncbi:hypothetical protein IFM60648_04166 [Aspergillus lentulus]|uniref:Uncharacterized protein n=1 Tax=Aspergillus lentulus TaxID=293939 RepID=A0ABQ1A5X8_ASPLE|nr:hypothetical protein IFM60648_04166 [Aspergillus lentulus]
MRVSVLLPEVFLPQSAIKLGRLVTNVDEPHQEYHDPHPDRELKILEKVETHYHTTDTLGAHRSLVSQLTAFLSSSVSRNTKTSTCITTEQVKTYYLDNNGEWFRDAVRSEHTRKWIERTIDEGEDIYVVIGYHTALDARIVEQSRKQNVLEGKLQIPITSALAASGVVMPFGDPSDPKLTGSDGHAEDRERQFVAKGEQVLAVQYRKIRFSFFSSKSVDKATLAKEARWERYDRPRYLQSDAEDILEVGLDDDLLLEGDRAKFIAESGEIILSSISINIK